jgi:uncharacterized SAM-binding protein YcdF (DUF218 family)
MRPAISKPGEMESGKAFFKLVTLIFVTLLCAVLYLARAPLLRFAGEEWIVEDPVEHADAIVLLSDDNFYADRATRAAELYRQGIAPVVVASGRRLRPVASLAELMQHDLVERGVPKERILKVEQDGEELREEASALARLAGEKKWKSVVIVTSNYQTRRARYVFTHIFPHGVRVGVASARDGDFNPADWWTKGKSINQLMQEMGGLAAAMGRLHGKPES